MKKLTQIFLLSIIFCSALLNVSTANKIDYDIIYVRYNKPPITDEDAPPKYTKLPQGERAYEIQKGADLVLLKPDGTERILVDCTICSVMDPTISFDGTTVYYSFIEEEGLSSASWLYKIKLEEPYTPIRLTYNDGFDSQLYAANTTPKHDQASKRHIRDMAPIPLADGRLLFTSNRSALTILNAGNGSTIKDSVQQLYTMEDHDGSLNTAKLANISRLETGTLHLAQHPIQLKDGRILFSTWQNVATKYKYAMTPLFTINPDGTNLRQFTEPHDHNKNVEHFITQLADEQVISTSYYPSYDYGFGILMRFPMITGEPAFIRGKMITDTWQRRREFARKGTDLITPHTTGKDIPAPEIDGIPQGKYSMPSATINNGLLVSYSQGYVNHFHAVCQKANKCEDLRAGIYLIPNANTNVITNKEQLIKIKDDPLYNEIWPKPVLSYQEIYGIEKPNIINSQLTHPLIKQGEATAIIGTSSMYNRETASDDSKETDPFQSNSTSRELHEGSWTIQGTDVGVYDNHDIYGVRIISTPPKPFTLPLSKYSQDPNNKDQWKKMHDYTRIRQLDNIIARYTSLHSERWEILGEFPLTNKESIDLQGNPDSSWAAKVPADTPLLIQAIDKNGMTLNSELTWRGLKSGEVRTDCGGCHAHSIESLDFSTTQTAKNLQSTKNITALVMNEVKGINYNDARVKNGLWDLSKKSTPVLSGSVNDPKITFVDKNVVSVEFRRDILPIINNKCISCHTKEGNGNVLILDSTDENNTPPYLSITNAGKYRFPQKGKYIRIAQARQSLLAWIVWGQRLDGRVNASRTDDLDYTATHHEAHQSLKLTDNEKRSFSRWIDLGSPINAEQTDGMGYTDDNQLPVINIGEIYQEKNKAKVTIGFIDVHSAIDYESIKVTISPQNSQDTSQETQLSPYIVDKDTGISAYVFSLPSQLNYVLEVEVKDIIGNRNIKRKIIKSNNSY